jgi:hypothetical protein
VIFTPKRSTNLAEKTLADGKSVKLARRQKSGPDGQNLHFIHQKQNNIIIYSHQKKTHQTQK